MTRRGFLRSFSAFLTANLALGGYAFAFEPMLRLAVTRYRLKPVGWPGGFSLKLAVLADIHAVEPGMTERRIRHIAEIANSLEADCILLLGDYTAGHRFRTGTVASPRWAAALKGLSAPHGVHAVLGNHDWWDDRTAQKLRRGPVIARKALEDVGIPVYENDALRLVKNGQGFWLAGLGDQLALRTGRIGVYDGVHDLDGTLAQIHDDAPVILLAHEPDIFPQVPDRVTLTLSGHTHGGQVRILGYSPVVPSRYRNRFAYGHVIEDGRNMIISGGLGCSIMPVRFGVPPELVLVELG